MFERYTETAKRTIFFAKYEAGRCGSPEIGTEHILLGLLKDAELTSGVLEGLSLQEISEKIMPESSEQREPSTPFDLALSNESRQALGLADEEAEKLGSRYVGNEHILLGLLRAGDCLGGQLLRQRRLFADDVRTQIAASRPRGEPEKISPQSRPPDDANKSGLVPRVRDLVRRGEQRKALKLVDELLAEAPQERDFRARMLCPIAMSISRHIGDLVLATRYCEELLSVAPDDLRTLYHLADYLDLQGQTVQARQQAARCYKLSLARNDLQGKNMAMRLEKRFPEVRLGS